ncbi:MAG: hypothetical protein LQ340_006741, partial [Diploschistes diacapsis]
MYHSSAVQRSPTEEEERMRRERTGSASQRLPPYSARSPTMAHYSYSPTNGPPPPATYGTAYASRPSSSAAMNVPSPLGPSQSPRLGPPRSPTNGLPQLSRAAYTPREQSKNTYYDPTSDHRETPSTWSQSPYANRSPVQREISAYYAPHPDPTQARGNHYSPKASYHPNQSPTFPNLHAHPSIVHEPSTYSMNGLAKPLSPRTTSKQSSISHLVNGNGTPGRTSDSENRAPRPKPQVKEEPRSARSDPMSFSNILSTTTVEAPKPPVKSTPPPKPPQPVESLNGDASSAIFSAPPAASTRKLARKSPAVKANSSVKETLKEPPKPKAARSSNTKKSTAALEKENQKVLQVMAEIDSLEQSDLDAPAWDRAKVLHYQTMSKRMRALDDNENEKRKRRRRNMLAKTSDTFSKFANQGKDRFRDRNENDIMYEVQKREVMDEKERKKDMQRKRRREKTVMNETQKQREAMEKASQAADNAEREKFLKEAQKAERKAKSTKRILDIGDIPEDLGEVSPMAHNLEGGTMTTFHSVNGASPEPPAKKQKKAPTSRPKKSKEKKQAEKDAAEAAYAAMERDELVPLAPKDKEETPGETPVPAEKKAKSKKAAAAAAAVPKDGSPVPPTTNYASKGYSQMYEQITRDIGKGVPKVFRMMLSSEETKTQNLKKTATLASKEAKRYQMKTNKSMKEFQARAKRISKEMGTFWKRNEKFEKEKQREAKKEEAEQQRRLEAEREAARQRRKLDFLISQTEIFSHFINKDLKTAQIEKAGSDGVGGAADAAAGGKAGAGVDLSADAADAPANFEDLDFDDEDDTARRNAATASARAALKKQQDKAKEFNGSSDMQQQMDDSELNFQNPSSLVSIDIPQPKMLTCQLKEYQLKGLNWLCDLWDKNINGILADEMGLGKTVQSISVMSYLAETHNIWGPFLVVAPASTLHNWEQEITRFVPGLKVLPYWGTAKDRKVLRKFWERKDWAYTKDSQFHVMVTSYQLVVQDAQYFQKMKWQYMILDEAQAIKSSQSSRWKSLLKFQSRNRLLLTGTPIQNNMQELWALLHFIMPSLFDSHDEFSEWFSKDIESHAQSNTKLDEAQLKRLHLILKPFMLRRVKKHVQKELGDKVEIDLFCDLAYRQRAYYMNLRNKVSLMELIEKAGIGDDSDAQTLMNLVVQFRKVCNHPDLFERAETTSPLSFGYFAEMASFIREGREIEYTYSVRNLIDYDLPRVLCRSEGRLDIAGPANQKAGFKEHYLGNMMNIWSPEYVKQSSESGGAFSWLKLTDTTASEACGAAREDLFARAVKLSKETSHLGRLTAIYEDTEDAEFTPAHSMLNIAERNDRWPLAEVSQDGYMKNLLNVSRDVFSASGLDVIEPATTPSASAPPIQVCCSDQASGIERQNVLFNVPIRKALYGLSWKDEQALLDSNIEPRSFPTHDMLSKPISQRSRYTNIGVPSMRRFVTDCGKLAKLDQLLRELREGNHRVLLYFQMTKMIDLMEEYLTYRKYKYCRLDGSTSIENRRDTVQDFQTNPDIFVFLLSTRAGGLGINLTSADTVIFYDSDWNPTIDSQAMDRAHRLGQTRQVTVYRLITRSTIEERIRKRALQKEEVQRVVITGESKGGVDFNTRSKDNKTKDMVMWLADDDEEAELIEKKEQELAAAHQALEEADKKLQ